MTTWSNWVHWANINCDVRLMNGGPATMIGVQRYAGKVKVLYRNRHETVLPQDIALVLEPGDVEATWVRPSPWKIEARPGWAEGRAPTKPSLVVEHDPFAVHPSFLPPADLRAKKLDISKLRMPRIDLDIPVETE